MVPLGDSIAESPHALGNSLGRHARGSFFGRVAASMRLSQNPTDVRVWSAALYVDLTHEWLTCTNVLQSKHRNFSRPMRVTPKALKHNFYHMGLMSQPVRTNAADEDGTKLPIADLEHVVVTTLSDEEPGEPKRRRRAGIDVAQVQHAQQRALMKECVLACLAPGKFISPGKFIFSSW